MTNYQAPSQKFIGLIKNRRSLIEGERRNYYQPIAFMPSIKS